MLLQSRKHILLILQICLHLRSKLAWRTTSYVYWYFMSAGEYPCHFVFLCVIYVFFLLVWSIPHPQEERYPLMFGVAGTWLPLQQLCTLEMQNQGQKVWWPLRGKIRTLKPVGYYSYRATKAALVPELWTKERQFLGCRGLPPQGVQLALSCGAGRRHVQRSSHLCLVRKRSSPCMVNMRKIQHAQAG